MHLLLTLRHKALPFEAGVFMRKREVPEGLYDQYWSCVRQIKGKMDVCYRELP